MIRLPAYTDYQLALQNPRIAFSLDADLSSASVETDGNRRPRARSGNFAYTYKLARHSQAWAVRCFSKYVPARDRYQAIDRFMRSRSESFLLAPSYVERGISVKGQWYPIIKMPWVSGETLSAYIDAYAHDQGRMSSLLRSFEKMVASLEAIGMAHGDLQHGNIMVSNGQLVLVDYDGTYVPGMQRFEVKERGHPNYQHPARDQEFGPTVDRFSAIVIHLALRGLIKQPGLWAQYGDGENLLFHQRDFINPDESKVLAAVERLSGLSSSVALFRRICKADVASVPRLEDFLANRVVIDLPTRAAEVTKWQLFQVLDATNREALLGAVGDRVTVVGRVVDFAPKTTTTGKPYAFLSFGAWQLGSFRLVVWAEGLETFRRQGHDLGCYAGKWVSVTGLMDEYRAGNGRHHPQIVVETPSEIEVLSGAEEARARLAGKGGSRPSATTATSQRRETPRAPTVARTPATTLSAQQHFSRGYDLHKAEKLEEAKRHYLEALKMDSRLPGANHNLGVIYQVEGKVDDAMRAFEAELQVQPNNALTHRQMGWLWCEKGRYDKSLQAFTRAIDLDPNDDEAYHGLGHSFGKQGRHADAVRAYQNAIRCRPTSIWFHNLAGHYSQLGDLVQAEQAYAKAVELDSTNVQAMKMRAYLQQTVDERRTEQLLLQVVRHRLAKDRLGEAQLLQQEVDRRPDWVEARVMLAEAYAALGRHSEAYQQATIASRTYGSREAQHLLDRWLPTLSLSRDAIAFGQLNRGDRPVRTFTVSNTGPGLLKCRVSKTASWLRVSPLGLECEPGHSEEVKVELADNIGPGWYAERAGVGLEFNGGSASVMVTALVCEPVLAVSENPQPVVLDRQGRGSTTASVQNTGTGSLVATFTAHHHGGAQVRLHPTTLTLGEGEQGTLTISVQVPRFDLRGGLPSDRVAIKSNGGDVELDWHSVISGPMLSVEPLRFDYGTYTTGEPPAHVLSIRNLGNEPLTGVIASSVDWVRLDAETLRLTPGELLRVTAQVVPEAAKLRFPQLSRNLEGEIVIATNGGEMTVPARLVSRHLGTSGTRRGG